jgi:hypothetical protein
MEAQRAANHDSHLSRWLTISGIVLVALLGAVLVILAIWWPFTRDATMRSLEEVSFSEVKIGRFQKSFFPPGYIAQDLTFRRDNTANTRPLARIGKITCRGSWLALLTFTHRITRMDLEGVVVYIPAHLPPAIRKHAEAKVTPMVTDLSANGAVLEIARGHEGSQTEHFDFPELALSNLAKNKATQFRTLMLNPNLFGRLASTGTVGPLMLGRIAETRISGDYHIRGDDLSRHRIVAGTLSADGRFDGVLGRTDVAGRTYIPDFSVTRSRHSLKLTAEYNVLVDATKGDVTVQSVEAHFLRSTLITHGSIAGRGGKTLALDVEGRQARIEDLLRLVVTANQPPMDGALNMHVHVVLPPKQETFLRRVRLQGGFTINGAKFTTRTTEARLQQLSARARGEKKVDVTSGNKAVPAEIKSNVKLDAGIAILSEALFTVPGAVARGAGTYNLSNEAIDLRGKLAMRTTLSKAAGGIKSVILMPIDPFFKKNGAGTVVPVRITGTYSHPVFKVLFTK